MNLFSMNRTAKMGAIFFLAPILIICLKVNAKAINPDNIICLDNGNEELKICRNFEQGFSQDSLIKHEDILTSRSGIIDHGDSGKTDIINYVKLPESSDFLTNTFSILAIIVSIGVPAWQRISQKSDANSERENNINDDYWIREVIMPKINGAILEIYNEYKDICSDTPVDYSSKYRSNILPKINELRDLFKLLTVFPKISQAAIELNNICDDFDDAIDNNEDKTSTDRKEGLGLFHVNITKALMLIHVKSL